MFNKLLILDLDETLIHGTEQPLDRPADLRVGPFYVYERPHVREFLEYCRDHFDVAIWTTATQNYAELILEEICPDNLSLQFIWCRDRCTPKGEGYDGEFSWIKDLKKVKNRGWSLDHVLVVEDKPENISRHYGNVVRIDPYMGDPEDRELLRLFPFLLELKAIDNVRKVEKRGWKGRFNS